MTLQRPLLSKAGYGGWCNQLTPAVPLSLRFSSPKTQGRLLPPLLSSPRSERPLPLNTHLLLHSNTTTGKGENVTSRDFTPYLSQIILQIFQTLHQIKPKSRKIFNLYNLHFGTIHWCCYLERRAEEEKETNIILICYFYLPMESVKFCLEPDNISSFSAHIWITTAS